MQLSPPCLCTRRLLLLALLIAGALCNFPPFIGEIAAAAAAKITVAATATATVTVAATGATAISSLLAVAPGGAAGGWPALPFPPFLPFLVSIAFLALPLVR